MPHRLIEAVDEETEKDRERRVMPAIDPVTDDHLLPTEEEPPRTVGAPQRYTPPASGKAAPNSA